QGGAPPSERPGLGTTWGERRDSRIRYVSFERAQSAPCSSLALHYNDARGVSAMVQHDVQNGAAQVRPGFAAYPELEVSLIDGEGRALPTARVGTRIYLVGEAGQRYAIQVK